MTLLTNIEASLPEYVMAVNDGFRGNPGSTNALPPTPPTEGQMRLRALDKGAPYEYGESWVHQVIADCCRYRRSTREPALTP